MSDTPGAPPSIRIGGWGRATLPWAFGTVAVAALFTMNDTFNWFRSKPDTGAPNTFLDYLPVFAIIVVTVAVVFGTFVRRAFAAPERPARTTLVLGALGILAIPAYWLGLPAVFAGAALATGLGGNPRRSDTSGRSKVAATGIALGFVTIAIAAFEAVER